jgi:hypothetical protein
VFVVEMGVDVGELGGRRVPRSGRSASQMVSGGVVTRSTVISYNSDNGVLRTQPARHQSASPQLSGYFDLGFFMRR